MHCRRSPLRMVRGLQTATMRRLGGSGLAIIHSNRDDPAQWVQAGGACQRFALQATALGARPQLQSLLGLGDRRPDLVLRFGYAPPMPRSLRRAPQPVRGRYRASWCR